MRQTLALQLRTKGHTLEEVAQLAGYGSRASAHKAIRKALAELPTENATELRAIENNRLNALALAYLDKASHGNIGAAHVILRVVEISSQLNGLQIAPEAIASSYTILVSTDDGYLDISTNKVIDAPPAGQGIVRNYGTDVSGV